MKSFFQGKLHAIFKLNLFVKKIYLQNLINQNFKHFTCIESIAIIKDKEQKALWDPQKKERKPQKKSCTNHSAPRPPMLYVSPYLCSSSHGLWDHFIRAGTDTI